MSKKIIASTLIGLSLFSSAYASSENNNTKPVQSYGSELSYCQKATLRGQKIANVNLAKIIEDTYSIQHHGEYVCEQLTEKEALDIEKSELYAFLLGMQISGNTLTIDRLEKAKISFFYEAIVSKAIESKVDTVAGIQKMIKNKNNEDTQK
jgi:hypothetical protein